MNILKSALVAVALFAAAGGAHAQTAVQVEPERIYGLAECQAKTLAQVNSYKAVATLMRGSQRVAVDDTTKVFLDRTADSFSNYAETLLDDAKNMDALAHQILDGSNGYASYQLVVQSRASDAVLNVAAGAFNLPPTSGPIDDLAIETAACGDLVTSIRSDLNHPQD